MYEMIPVSSVEIATAIPPGTLGPMDSMIQITIAVAAPTKLPTQTLRAGAADAIFAITHPP